MDSISNIDSQLNKEVRNLQKLWKPCVVYTGCEFCYEKKECDFLQNKTTSRLEKQNKFSMVCLNYKCKRKTCVDLPNVYCTSRKCNGYFKPLILSFMMHESMKAVVCVCNSCDTFIFSPFVCIHEDCYYPLCFKQDTESKEFFLFCLSCSLKNSRSYNIQINTTTAREKQVVHDPTLPRDFTTTCPKCLQKGAIVCTETRTIEHRIFDYKFYCSDTNCVCSWKVYYK